MPKEREGGDLVYSEHPVQCPSSGGPYRDTISGDCPFLQVTPRCISGAVEARGEGGAPIESMHATAFILLF